MTNAIILCAGRSKLDIKLGYPKCLCDLGGETILERQIRLLREYGIDEIYIAVGNKADEIADKTRDKMGWNIKFLLVNWWWKNKQRHYGSFYTAWQLRDKWSDTIILYGDLVYSKKALLEMINCPLTRYGFILLLSDEKGTRWSPHEDFGIRMKAKGAIYLKRLKGPFRLSIDPNHLYPIYNMQIMALWWYFEWKYGEKMHFTPENFVQDVDGVEGLELARERVKRFK